MGPREGGLGSGLGEGLGMQWETIRLGPVTRIGQVEPRGAGSGWGGVGHALVDRPSGAACGRACIGIQLNYSKTTRLGQVGPRGAGSGRGRVGPDRVEWGWGGVGHALGFN